MAASRTFNVLFPEVFGTAAIRTFNLLEADLHAVAQAVAAATSPAQ